MPKTQRKHSFRGHHGGVTDLPPESPRPPEPDATRTRVLPPDRDPAASATPRQRFVDRVWSFRALIAVALASVILGGLAGAALASVGDHQDRRDFPGRFHRGGQLGQPGERQWHWGDGPRDDRMPRGLGPRQWYQQQPRMPGVPPGTPTVPSQPRQAPPKATPSP